MTSRPLTHPIARRLVAPAIILAVAAALAVTMLLAAGPSPASASVQETASVLDSSLATADTPAATGDRAKLRADLKAARKLTGQDRKDAVAKVRADAASGKYGDKIKERVDRRSDRRAAVLALLPDQLQSDLKDLKAADKDKRKDMRDAIRAKALAGGYGDKVQAAAKQLQDHWKK